ncbi:MAG: Fe-S cluster biogenesis protein NfuA [Roseivirga sp.]|jgi:Fe-S cluster biogenesis protein NfuA
MVMIDKVEAALDKIRPFLKADGGDVRVLEITEDMVVRLELVGACETCPMSHMTMKAGIEEAIKRDIPEIKSVVAVNTETAV